MDIQPVGTIRVLNHVSSDPEKQKEWSAHWMKQGFEGIFMHIKVFALCMATLWESLTGFSFCFL